MVAIKPKQSPDNSIFYLAETTVMELYKGKMTYEMYTSMTRWARVGDKAIVFDYTGKDYDTQVEKIKIPAFAISGTIDEIAHKLSEMGVEYELFEVKLWKFKQLQFNINELIKKQNNESIERKTTMGVLTMLWD